MKKLQGVLLTLILVFLLCACGKEAAQTTASPSATDANATTPEEASVPAVQTDNERPAPALTVQLRMEGEVTFQLDAGNNVVSVEAGDQKTQALLSKLELAGKPYAEAMGLVLKSACDGGALQHNSHITLSVKVMDISAQLLEQLRAPVSQLKEETGIILTCHMDLQPCPLPDPSETTAVIGGQEIHLVVREYDDGTEYIYTTSKANIDDVASWVVNVFHWAEGGTSTCFLENGKITKELHSFLDGGQSILIHQGDELLRPWAKEADGSEMWSSYYEDGTLAYERNLNADGSYYYTTYTEAGSPSYQEILHSDGLYEEYSYHDNGYRARYATQNPDGSHGQTLYGYFGNVLLEEYYEANGDYSITEYYSNGAEKHFQCLRDGQIGEITYYVSSAKRYESWIDNGIHYEWEYDTEGVQISYKETPVETTAP